MFTEGITRRLKDIFQEIAERYEFEIDTMEAMEDYIDDLIGTRNCPYGQYSALWHRIDSIGSDIL